MEHSKGNKDYCAKWVDIKIGDCSCWNCSNKRIDEMTDAIERFISFERLMVISFRIGWVVFGLILFILSIYLWEMIEFLARCLLEVLYVIYIFFSLVHETFYDIICQKCEKNLPISKWVFSICFLLVFGLALGGITLEYMTDRNLELEDQAKEVVEINSIVE